MTGSWAAGHSTESLAGLLAGELPPAEAADVGRHLSACDACRRELAVVATVTGALVDAARLAPVPASELPPLRTGRPPASRRRPAVYAAAALAVAASVAGLALLLPRSAGPGPAPQVGVALRPVGSTAVSGTARMAGEREAQHMQLHVTGLASQPEHFYEVWLLDPAHGRALALGVLPADGDGEYVLPASVTAGYTAVDVSSEPEDGNPAHSAVSVARGTL